MLKTLWSRLRNLFHRRRDDAEMSEEFRAHLALAEEEHLRRGLPPYDARYAAKRDFGGVEQVKEIYRERRGLPLIDNFLQDLRFAARMLRKNPGFAAVAVLTLALGIGASVSIFSVVNALLLRPLPFPHSDRLVMLQESLPKVIPGKFPVSAPDIGDFRRLSHSFDDLGTVITTTADISGDGTPQRVTGARTSAAVFRVLGVAPLLGRMFTEDEDKVGNNVVILSYPLWQSRYGGDPGILGRKILVNREPYIVIGVMPKTFEFPENGLFYFRPADLWTPIAFTAQELSDEDRGDNFNFGVLGRLKPGISIAAANADVMRVAEQIQEQFYPVQARDRSKIALEGSVNSLTDMIVGDTKRLLFLLLGAVALLLLIACANVANLLLARGTERQREIAVRTALGAGKGRVIRQLLAESGLLSIFGGALGLLVAYAGVKALPALAATLLPRVREVSLDSVVVLFTLGISLASALIFGIVPAFTTAKTDLNEALKEGGRTESASRGHRRLRDAFVVAQIALAFPLVIGSGLLIRSFVRARETAPGFKPEGTIAVPIVLPASQYNKISQVEEFFDRVSTAARAVPGVTSVAVSSDLPLNSNWNRAFIVEGGAPAQTSGAPMSYHTLVEGDYFQTLGIPLIAGRFFNDAEIAGHGDVIIISEGMAKRYWPDADPIGKRVHWGAGGETETHDPWLTIIGVVGDVKQGALDERTGSHTYETFRHEFPGPDVLPLAADRNLLIRSTIPSASVANQIRGMVQRLDPQQPVGKVLVLQDVVSESLAPRRFDTWLLAVFGVAALLLAAIGVYGVISYTVARQTHELGVRVALGAQPGDILGSVAGRGLHLAFIGVVIGLAASYAATRLLTSLLYDVKATDPLTFGGVAVLLLLVALTACWIPARRAMRVDPVVALRYE
jgi:predicted permease